MFHWRVGFIVAEESVPEGETGRKDETYETYQTILDSKVVSTHLCNTPLNLYQKAKEGFLS